MGCCLSNPNLTSPPNKFDDEETVKEVLSETPKPKPESESESEPEPEPETEAPKINEQNTKCNIFVSPRHPFLVQKLLPKEESTSEVVVSNVFTLSDSISNNTPSEDPPMPHKPQGQNRHFTLGNNHYNNHCNKIISNHNNVHFRSHGRLSPVKRVVGPSPPRKYPGAGTGRVESGLARRCRSPLARPNVGRSPSYGRNGMSPGRVRMGRGPEEEEWAGPEESLENPLVSLECFIFL
ncbi:hypothetical protein vseg_011390 [Gypsophila vaccaria]